MLNDNINDAATEPQTDILFRRLEKTRMGYLHRKIILLAKSLPTRPYNILLREMQSDGLAAIARHLYYSDSFGYHIERLGSSTREELNSIKQPIIRYIQELLDCPDEVLFIQERKLMLEEILYDLTEESTPEEVMEELFDERRRIKLFALLDFTLRESKQWTPREREVIQLVYTTEKRDPALSLADILGIKEKSLQLRLRRLSYRMNRRFENLISDIKDDLRLYITENKDLQADNRLDYRRINAEENVQFTPLFYDMVFRILATAPAKPKPFLL